MVNADVLGEPSAARPGGETESLVIYFVYYYYSGVLFRNFRHFPRKTAHETNRLVQCSFQAQTFPSCPRPFS